MSNSANIVKAIRIRLTAADLAYEAGHPILTDTQYDALLKELRILEDSLKDVDSTSPTQQLVSSVTEGIEHMYPMLSIHNAFTDAEFLKWAKGYDELHASVKIDGFAVELVYENGTLICASTRGNGLVGEEITHKALLIPTVPYRISYTQKLAVYGEMYLPLRHFNPVEQGTPRNTAVGIIRSKSNAQTPQLEFAAYNCYPVQINLLSARLEFLAKLGFNLVKYTEISSSEDAVDYYMDCASKRDTYPYATDGVVFKDDYIQPASKLSTKYANDAIAWKFSPNCAITKLHDIEWQVGRTGTICPVASLNPIEVEGVTITAASLYNIDMVMKAGYRKGDLVEVQRAGFVIPKVVRIVQPNLNGEQLLPPNYCPSCGDPLHDGMCLNSKRCPAQTQGLIAHFVTKEAINIPELGPITIEVLLLYGLIETALDLFYLKRADLEIVFGPKHSEKIYNAIQAARATTTARFLYALSIPNIGKVTAAKLGEVYSGITVFDAAERDLAALIGPTASRSVVVYGRANREYLKHACDLLTFKDIQKVASTTLANTEWVFTGKLHIPRIQAQEFIVQYGGKYSTRVSKATTHVVIGQDAGVKAEAANRPGITIMTGEEFALYINQLKG